MASLSITGITSNSCNWQVTGLSAYWNSVNFQRVVVALGTTTNGSSTPPSNILQTAFPPTSGSNNYAPVQTLTGLNAGWSYTFNAYTLAKNGYWYYADSVTFNTFAPPAPIVPSKPTIYSITSTASTIDINWNSSTNASYYIVGLNSSPVAYPTETSYRFTELDSYTNYTVSVGAYNSSSNKYSDVDFKTIYTKDVIAPTVSTAYADGGTDSITIFYGATDYQSGINRIELYVGTKNGSSSSLSLKKTVYSNSGSEKFTTDGNDYSFGVGKYYIGVKAFDNSGNSSSIKTNTWTIKESRPTDFSWTNSKLSGSSFNLTATEWNNFTNKINAFRKYKEISNYAFTNATKGYNFTAAMYNEARNAINGMTPPTPIPNYKNAGDHVLASDINKLVTSLNSIK